MIMACFFILFDWYLCRGCGHITNTCIATTEKSYLQCEIYNVQYMYMYHVLHSNMCISDSNVTQIQLAVS